MTDLMSTNSNLDVREDREGRVRGAEAIENKISTLDQFSKLFSKVTPGSEFDQRSLSPGDQSREEDTQGQGQVPPGVQVLRSGSWPVLQSLVPG